MSDKIQKVDVATYAHSELKKLYEECTSLSTNEFERKMRIIDVHVKLVSVWLTSG